MRRPIQHSGCFILTGLFISLSDGFELPQSIPTFEHIIKPLVLMRDAELLFPEYFEYLEEEQELSELYQRIGAMPESYTLMDMRQRVPHVKFTASPNGYSAIPGMYQMGGGDKKSDEDKDKKDSSETNDQGDQSEQGASASSSTDSSQQQTHKKITDKALELLREKKAHPLYEFPDSATSWLLVTIDGKDYRVLVTDFQKVKDNIDEAMDKAEDVATTLDKLQHSPHIVLHYGNTLEEDETDDAPLMVFSSFYDCDLYQLLTILYHFKDPDDESVRLSAPLAANLSKEWGKQLPLMIQGLFDALAYIHEKKIIHFFLAPQNILIRQLEDGRYQFVLSNFSYNKDAGDLIGSNVDPLEIPMLAIMPPFFADQHHFTETPGTSGVDLWQLGILLGMLARKEVFSWFYKELSPSFTSSDSDFDYHHFAIGLRGRVKRLLPPDFILPDVIESVDPSQISLEDKLLIAAWYLLQETNQPTISQLKTFFR